MLRFLYILSLFLCIELSFCYNYIEEATERNTIKLGQNVRRDKMRRLKRPKERKTIIRQEYDYDRSPVEFDVASFIQPDEETLDDEEAYRYRNGKRRPTSTTFDYGSIMDMNLEDGNKKRDKIPDYLNIGDSPPDLNINPPLFKDTINTKHLSYNSLDDLHGEKYGHEKFRNIYKDDLLMDQNVVHNHAKKCTLKHIKFPFFSHNKSEPLKPKKNRKRKLFCFNCPKKEDRKLKLPDDNKIGDDPMIHYKIKRSYEEKLCPSCKKRFVSNEHNTRIKKTPKKIVHNSRQFYQTSTPDSKLKDVTKIKKINRDSEDDGDAYYRRKRDDDNRERQLKELEEVQRKIDSVEIHLPTFVKPADILNNG